MSFASTITLFGFAPDREKKSFQLVLKKSLVLVGNPQRVFSNRESLEEIAAALCYAFFACAVCLGFSTVFFLLLIFCEMDFIPLLRVA